MTPLRQRAVPFALLLAAFIAAHAGSTVAYGATFTVNATFDAVDANPGDGVCDVNIFVIHSCTLRAAIMEANALPGLDVILLPTKTYVLAIPPTSPAVEDSDASAGDLDITGDLGIFTFGPMSTVSGGEIDRIFHVHRGAGVTISGLAITKGIAAGSRDGGGILNEGQLALLNSLMELNFSRAAGGAIANKGWLTLIITTVRTNFAEADGGGISSWGTVSLMSSTVSKNGLKSDPNNRPILLTGAGISNHGGVLHVLASTISDNSAESQSEIAYGGGIYNTGLADLINTTVSGNRLAARSNVTGGGGIANETGTVFLNNSTVVGNREDGIYTKDGTTQGGNTIIQGSLFDDCTGPFFSLGYNLNFDNTCNLTQPGDLPGAVANLGPLQNNGGWTETHALEFGGAGINAANNAWCPATDQRGVTRPQGPRCDIGAYELEVGHRTRRDP